MFTAKFYTSITKLANHVKDSTTYSQKVSFLFKGIKDSEFTGRREILQLIAGPGHI
jgi:hypothetical protein